MILFVIFILTFVPVQSLGQIECFDFSNHCWERFELNDSTFKFTFGCGLSTGVVDGSIHRNHDTLLINSEFDPNDYHLEYDSNTTVTEIFQLDIREIRHTNAISIQTSKKKRFEGTVVFSSNNDWLLEEVDTIITQYLLYRDSIDHSLNVTIWRKTVNGVVVEIPIDIKYASALLDLTEYPATLDYAFYKDQMAIIRGGNLILLNKKGIPIKINKRSDKKGKICRRRKRIKEYKPCE